MNTRKLAVVISLETSRPGVMVFTTKQTAELTGNHDFPTIPILWNWGGSYRLFPVKTLQKIYACRKSLHKKVNATPADYSTPVNKRNWLYGYAHPLLAILWEQGIEIKPSAGIILSGGENEQFLTNVV